MHVLTEEDIFCLNNMHVLTEEDISTARREGDALLERGMKEQSFYRGIGVGIRNGVCSVRIYCANEEGQRAAEEFVRQHYNGQAPVEYVISGDIVAA